MLQIKSSVGLRLPFDSNSQPELERETQPTYGVWSESGHVGLGGQLGNRNPLILTDFTSFGAKLPYGNHAAIMLVPKTCIPDRKSVV